METKTAWQSVQLPRFPKVSANGRYDVVVIGGGITGLTAAYLLKRAGKKVCLLERQQLAGGDTGCTTAHLTCVTDLRLSEMVCVFGKDAARLVWQGGASAVNTIEEIAKSEEIECEFRRVPGFLHAALHGEQDESAELQADCDVARELGFAAAFSTSVPCVGKPGVAFANQAKFHPLKYLAGLARVIDGDGCAIFEESSVDEVEGDPMAVKVNDTRIECDYLVIATHVPLMGKAGLISASLFQTKLASYSSYAIGAKIKKDSVPEASFWDTSDPYYYLRVDRPRGGDSDYAVFGGQDHKTGQVDDTVSRFDRLETILKELIPGAKVDARWSGQVVQTHDGLPYIGEMADKQFVATGFAGNGMTFGTLAAMMACDAALGRDNPWRELFDVGRKKLRGGVWDFLKENFDYPYYLVRDRFRGADASSTRAVKRGQGKIVQLDGQSLACYRDEKGKLSKLSKVCTHLGCIVHWNEAERTWDCPCHGSRFLPTGEVLAGPAESPLEPATAEKPHHETAARRV